MVEDLISDAAEVVVLATAEVAGAVVEEKVISKVSRRKIVLFLITFLLALIAVGVYLLR